MLTPDAIDIFLDHALDGVNLAHLRTLIGDLFAKQPDVAQVRVRTLPGSSAGLSSLSLVLAQPITHDGAEYHPVAIRIGQAAAIAAEYQNYTQYVEPFTRAERPQLHATSAYGGLAALSYAYLGSVDAPIQTLRDYLWQHPDQQRALTAIRNLFTDTLAGSGGQNGWHMNARLFANQCPGWFYNRVLPPVLSLKNVRVGHGGVDAQAVKSLLARADQPEARSLLGQRITLGVCAGYPLLQEVEAQPMDAGLVRLRLHLLAGNPMPAGIYRPLDPVAARIELIIPAEDVAHVRAALLQEAPLEAQVVQTRYTLLYDQIERHGLRQVENLVGQNLADPLAIYATLLDTPISLHTSIIHGDLNLGNILMREYGPNGIGGVTAWLIDFDQTRPGGHTVFDLVKLEMEYKLHILSHRLRSRVDVLRLEAALHAALTNPSDVERYLDRDHELVRAYEFILRLRQLALKPVKGGGPRPYEYYLGLIGYGLAALKYRNLYDQGRERWVQPQARIEPLASVAYLSAAYAATVIEQIRKLETWPNQVQAAPRPLRRHINPRGCGVGGSLHPLYQASLRRSSIGGF
ncbi:phosphotransferase [Candidatus Oscillochloris fontis]|uniref:phosphotransferase n=1 Tax=Candidatus Oscillochloris fontis TaxID=2496868 RepID=UPI00101D285A|nr:phosphotransferase [Candidatus Oscillochloris fontis]